MGKASDKPIKYVVIRDYLAEKYLFRFNTVAIDLEYADKEDNIFKPLNPADLEEELYEQGFTGFDKQLNTLLKTTTLVPRFNPIVEYFQNLQQWDGQTDYIETLADYVQTTDQDFWRAQFKKMLVRMIAQAFGKIGFNKQCIVLFSKQNDGKTYFWEYLVNGTPLWDYYKKNPDIIGKEAKRALAENFLLNLDELSALTKQDVNQVKATFSESQIKVRLPYDKKDSIMPRNASFVGSTNKREFLVDETGNVRWVVFEIIIINHNEGQPGGYVDVDINKVWAQAFYLFINDYVINLTKEDLAHSEANNEKYGARTVEYQMLLQHFTPSDKENGGQFFQPFQLAQILSSLVENRVRIIPENIGRALTKMGVERKAHRIGQNVAYGYWLKQLPNQGQTLEMAPVSGPF
ncbi:VapE domain-containing protein [Spirosoma endophyticum]|uniref:Virulence-associated protein E n=1 Tax=Spirosoma endophyticum TaxID=662367 RepID=A0A1I1U8T2_9BACT|nr:VapE domain-containing protein [Spirosoma endophyticum]SFD67242.1 Virulence-associated protein E [Spirosoma endophyticum]